MSGRVFGVIGRSGGAGRRRAATVAAGLALVGLAFSIAVGPVGAAAPTTWHRLNIYSNPPEHERFSCLPGDTWRCRYDKLPDPKLGLAWDQTRGTFTGVDTTGDWVCPDWFPAEACDAADTVISGQGTFVFPRASGGFSVDQQLLVSDDGRLWVYWTDQFACPWYPSFGDAIVNDANCVFGPS